MKSFLFLLLTFFSLAASAQTKSKDSTSTETKIVEASCGKCQFEMQADDCELAVRIDGKVYVVDGIGINDHGNAHANEGFCNAIRKAEVKGKIVNNKFRPSYFKLVPLAKKS